MSTLFNTTTSVPLIRHGPCAAPDHQSGSWAALVAIVRLWGRWVGRARQRDALADLIDNEHLLDDIGLTRDDVLDEINKPFWH
jgi:uncharacterized protein YjiS (DUF1127 family)